MEACTSGSAGTDRQRERHTTGSDPHAGDRRHQDAAGRSPHAYPDHGDPGRSDPSRSDPGRSDPAAPNRDRAAEFLSSFDRLAQAVRRARGTTPQDSDGVLTLSQYAILQALTEREQARVRDLAVEAGIAPSTATRILDALERRVIVTRTRSPEDRRGVTVTLTEFGREALRAQDSWLRGRQRAFFDGLPPHEQELAPDLLVRLAALIDELAAGPEP